MSFRGAITGYTRGMTSSDAVVIGGGHNGLVAAANLAGAGWGVTVLEAQPDVGGAVRSAELFLGYRSDLFSAFHPLAVASPAFRELDLESHGLRWSHAQVPFGHPLNPDDRDAVLVHHDAEETAAQLAQYDKRDGRTWLELFEQWQAVRPAVINTLFGPFPPVRGPMSLLRALGSAESLRFARFMLLPANRMVTELFHSEQARLPILGNAMHADIPLDAPGSGVMGYLLTMLAQDTGFPVPVGGAGALTDALVRKCESLGVDIVRDCRATDIEVESGKATTVRTVDGRRWKARKAVVADVSAPALYRDLLPRGSVPERVLKDLDHFEWDAPVVKVNYALSGKVPWTSANLTRAGTVHVGADRPGMVQWMADLTTGVLPEKPFMLFGQMTAADSSRSPEGTESAWAYTHLPRGIDDTESATVLAGRVDDVLEAHAPGFRELIVGRHVQTPSDLAGADENLHAGAVNGGTSQLYQQLIFRPSPGLGRPETSVEQLFLGSASAHPGGGVHGTCGRNAARAALAASGVTGIPRRLLIRKTIDLLNR